MRLSTLKETVAAASSVAFTSSDLDTLGERRIILSTSPGEPGR